MFFDSLDLLHEFYDAICIHYQRKHQHTRTRCYYDRHGNLHFQSPRVQSIRYAQRPSRIITITRSALLLTPPKLRHKIAPHIYRIIRTTTGHRIF